MIRHTILFKTKADVSAKHIQEAMKGFLDLQNKLTGVITMLGGACHFNESVVRDKANKIFTHSISIDFEEKRDIDNFFNNPVTNSAKDGIVNIVEGGYEGIIGFELVN